MKKFSKKLLSILVSIAMLIGIALPAGVISASASEDPTVTMVDFDLQANGETPTDTSNGGSYYIGVAKYGAGTEASPYVLSFDYYMPNASNVKVRNIGGDAGNGTWLSGSDATLQQGYHTFSASFSASNGAFYSRLVIFGGSFLADKDDVIYVWNITVTKDGEKCEIEPHSSDSTVYVNSTKTLSQYDWAKPTLSVSTLPTKTTYALGEKLDTTGMVVTLSDIFGNSDTIAAEDYTVSGFDSSTVGEKTVTVTYGDYTATFTVTVGDPTITKVDFTKLAAHIADTTKSPNVYAFVYHIGKSTEAEPFTVHFKYYLPGDSTVTVENSGNHCTRTGGSDFTLLKGYNVFEATYVTTETGTTFVPWLVCSTVDTQIYVWDVSVTKNGKAVSDYVRPNGTYPVEDNQRATATEVGTLSSQSWAKPTLSVSTLPAKTTYALGEKLDTTGMVVTLSDIFGNSETIAAEEYTLSGFDSKTGGEKPVTVTYGDYTATFTVTVNDPTVTKIDFTTFANWYDATYDRYHLNEINAYNSGPWASLGSNAEAVWEISFDYYLPTDSTVTFRSVSGEDTAQTGSSDKTLLTGYNRFVYRCTSSADNAAVTPALKNEAMNTQLYMWNYTVKVFDTVVTTTNSRYSSSSSATETEVGTLSYQIWYSTMNDPTVTKIDFGLQADGKTATYNDSENGKYWRYCFGTYSNGAATVDVPYVLSFDYYMPNECSIGIEIIGSDTNGTPIGGYVPSLEQGRHTFTCSFTTTSNGGHLFAPSISLLSTDLKDNVNEVIYVWIYRVTKGSTTYKPTTVNTDWQTVYATGTSVPAADMTVAEETENLGAQLRIGDKSIRFVGAIECDGVIYNPGAAANYDNATITIDGKVYDLVGAGIVFARDKKLTNIPEIALRLDEANVYNVSAKKIQSPENAAQLGFGGDGIVFTAVIMNIPRDNWDETLSARPYVKYIDKNGDEQVLYGDIVSRSVMQVKEGTDSEGPSSSMDKEAGTRREEILGNIEATPTTGTVYYVDAVNGDDSNDGMSENSAWKTLDKVNEQEGSESTPITVLFKRGDTWRGTLTPTSYTTYGAYGSGDKPQILGSMMNYANAEEVAANGLTWTLVNETLNKWQLEDSGEYLNKNAVSESTTGNNVGAIFFFDADKKLIANGKMSTEEDIYAEYAFYQQINYGEPGTVGDLYVCLPTGMTPESYADIEISTNTVVIGLPNYADNNHITIDNLCLKYGTFGIAAHGHYVSDNWAVNDLTVTNCEIAYIGGAMSGTAESHVRYGNGIEIYGPCNEVEVRNNWIHQCYDAGYSNQGEIGTQQNISVTGNLIEYCNYSLEIWMNATTGLIKDADYSGNMLRFAGYQFERDNRIGGSTEAISHLNFFFGAKPCINVTVADNIIDTSYRTLACVAYPNSTDALPSNEVDSTAKKGPTISGNTWIQGYDRYSFVAYMKDKNDESYATQELGSNNQAEMEASVSAIDTAPEAIKLDK